MKNDRKSVGSEIMKAFYLPRCHCMIGQDARGKGEGKEKAQREPLPNSKTVGRQLNRESGADVVSNASRPCFVGGEGGVFYLHLLKNF